MLSVSLGLAILSPCLVSCVSQETPSETKATKKKKRKRSKPEHEDMLAPPNMTLGEATRKYIPASRFNEGTPLTDADYVRAAEVAIHQRDDGSSMTLASEAIRLNPKSAAAYYVRGRARYGGLADGEKSSIDDLKRSIELGLGGPSTAGAWHSLARAYDAQKDVPRAIEAIEEAIRLRPDDQAAYRTKAAILTANNRKQEAIGAYSMALKLKPEDAEMYFQRGQLFENLKQFDDALKDYEGAIVHGREGNQMPYKLMALKREASIFSKDGKFQKAADVLSIAISIDKFDEELHRLRGEAYERLHKYAEAVADYSKAIEMAPDFSQHSYEARARCYEKLGKVDLAAADLKESKRLMDAPAERPLYELKH
ncbi:tetratricopeptide repeat protein [Candidatus Obscuribacterales bacterium]|nr:tetratricopeptide repeat protein [Candidatus Obscuribacterales bacterium]